MCNDSLGQCVSIQRCSKAIEFNDGSHMFQVRFGDDEEEVENCHYLETCCDPESIIEVLELPNFPDQDPETGDQITDSPSGSFVREATSPRTPPPYPIGNDLGSDENAAVTDSPISEENRNEEDPEDIPVTQSVGVFTAPVTHTSISINVSHFRNCFPKF